MSFVVDTDTCSAYLKLDRNVYTRFSHYMGGLYVSAATFVELQTWRDRANAPAARRLAIDDLFALMPCLSIDTTIAAECGTLRATLLDRGIVIAFPDLLIATTALVHDYTLVTHNVRHFSPIPGLRIMDWVKP
jgi:tRNA(fMet)-specific endonuclease VapC